jgi:hypothetical protein
MPVDRDYIAEFETGLVGRICSVQRREHDWIIDFQDEINIVVSTGTPWRIIRQGRIAFASSDDGQKFGLPAPIDGEVRVRELLDKMPVTSTVIDRQTADIAIDFVSDMRLEIFNNSSGYEGWQAHCRGIQLIGLGGGDTAVWGDV